MGEEAEQSSHQKQIDTTKALDELLKSGKASESEIYAKIEEYKEQFADYGRDRRSAMEFHLRNVERLLMPTQTTSFIMNTLKGTHNNTGASTSIDGSNSSSSSSSSSKAKNTTGTTSTTTPMPTHNTTTTPGGNTTPTSSSDNEVKVKNEDNIDEGGEGVDQNQSMTSIPTQNITTSSVAAATAIMTSPTKYDSNDTHHPEPQHTTSSSEKSPTPPPPPATTSTATTSSVFAATASSYTPPKNSKELFTHIVKILEVTPEQAGALKDSRFVAQEMDVTLKETLICLKELRGRLEQCGQDLDTEFNCIRQILTPSQSAKFLVWVAQNKACMHMLNELWSKNYIDHTTDSLSSPTTTAMEIAAETATTTAETSMPISTKTFPSSSSSEE